jgi:putative DNA primase/helicase
MAGKEAFSSVKVDKFNNEESVQQLDGKLFNISGETPRRGFDESAGLKELVGGDMVTARKLWVGQYTFRNTAKIIFSCNEIPRTLDNTHGFYRRFWVVNFNQRFDADAGTADEQIDEKLEKELPGIYNRVRRAYQAAKARGSFTEGSGLKAAAKAMRESMDIVGTWITENIKHAPGAGTKLSNKALYAEFVKDMEQLGHGSLIPAYSADSIGRRILAAFRGVESVASNGVRYKKDLVWVGENRPY